MGSRPDDEYDVFFVDFGDREWVTGDRIVPAWSGILQLPLQATECSLVNVQPFGKFNCTVGLQFLTHGKIDIYYTLFLWITARCD